MSDFTDNLKRLREKNGLTRKELAEKTGFSQSSITYYETGKSMPTVTALCAIASALGVSLDELTGYTPLSEYELYKNMVEQIAIPTEDKKAIKTYTVEECEDGKIKIIPSDDLECTFNNKDEFCSTIKNTLHRTKYLMDLIQYKALDELFINRASLQFFDDDLLKE
ncbi:hypothetical protein NZ47_11440 [Anaerovibrio lipolyticus]|uniref:HTH cro/C1-type domain-containing protein n=1 Tax=Anaerovibrio lipolyticus TaxID=82374 RepID=A0A0B2JUE3_9FIRM|nr:helix-turn-helix transcriptional regulator [Anaerovibrio lipolyticus]KHM51269.1 hypothetical protein NZ47_11440 [Anaerovibrio lipolyticus]